MDGQEKAFNCVPFSFPPDSEDDIHTLAVIPDEKDKATTIKIPRIHPVEKVKVFLKCVKCTKRVFQPMATAVVHYDRCSCFMRSSDCAKCCYATIVVDARDGNKQLYLTVFNEILQGIVEDLPTTADTKVCKALLLLDNITITDVNNRHIVLAINTK